MIRVIKNAKTGEYFTKGNWTPYFDKAQTFEGVAELVKVWAALKLKDVEMVLRLDPERPGVKVPLPNP
jgi:hypothetical protein